MNCLLLLSLLVASPVSENATKIGDRVEALFLTDLNYLPRSLDELGEHEATVLVFVTNDCPVAQRYVPRITSLEKEYRERDVRFAFVNVGPEESVVDVATARLESEIEFPVFKDFGAVAARSLGVTRTPEAVVLDREWNLRYRGRVDRQYRVGGVSPRTGREDLREALNDVLAGRSVRVKKTPVDGCAISAGAVVQSDSTLSWAEDIAPIVYRNCVECHRPNGEGPFSLIDYEGARNNAEMIVEVIKQRRMPPWYASDHYGNFPNRRELTIEERQLIEAWVLAGAPPGELSRAPAVPPLPTGDWEIGEPDLIVTQVGMTRVPEEGFVPYQYIILPHIFTTDTWVSALQILPENGRVLHHANLAYFKVGEKVSTDNFITGQVPGGDPMQLGDGVAVMIPAGSMLALQAHYVTTGKKEKDRLRVGIQFPRETVIKRLRHYQIMNKRFRIPPHEPAYPVRANVTTKQDILGVGMFSHMHLRGRDMTFYASFPDGTEETLLMIPNYSFDWQMSYRFDQGGRRFPAGTRLDVVAHYDNSEFNPYNPAPDKEVRFGPQTIHEMMYGFFFYLIEGENLGLVIDPENGHVME